MEKHKNDHPQPNTTTIWAIIAIVVGAVWLLGILSSLTWIVGPIITLLSLAWLFGPFIGLYEAPQTKTEHFDEVLNGLESAEIDLRFSVGENTVRTGSDRLLLSADIAYIGGDVALDVAGQKHRTVRLYQRQISATGFDIRSYNPLLFARARQDLHWDVQLSPAVPLALRVNGGVGESELDLGSLKLTGAELHCGVGAVEARLPGSSSYTLSMHGGLGALRASTGDSVQLAAELRGGVGDMALHLGSGTTGSLMIKGGVGKIELHIPADVPVEILATTGLGVVRAPEGLPLVSGGGEDIGRQAVWRTANFGQSDRRLSIEYSGGVGEMIVRYSR